MEEFPVKNNFEDFYIYVIPVYTLLGIKMRYEFPDAFYYGFFLIYSDGQPKYYFFAPDKKYEPFMTAVLNKEVSIEGFLENLFKQKGLNLTVNNSCFGVAARRKEELKTFRLEELPLHVFDDKH